MPVQWIMYQCMAKRIRYSGKYMALAVISKSHNKPQLAKTAVTRRATVKGSQLETAIAYRL